MPVEYVLAAKKVMLTNSSQIFKGSMY